MDSLYIPLIILHLSIVTKTFYCNDHTITEFGIIDSKTPLLHMLYYMNWLTHDFWTRTGGWEFDRSHGSGTSSPSHWQQVEVQAPEPVGWMMCFRLMTFVPVQKLCVNIYIYIYIYMLFYMSSVFFGSPIVSCSLIIVNTRMFVTCGICFKQHVDTRYLVFYNPSPPRMFLSLDLLSEYRIQHGAIGPLYV